MDRWAIGLYTSLTVLMFLAVWRAWVLGRQVGIASDEARAARFAAADRTHGSSLPVSMYPVYVHAGSAASGVTVRQKRPDIPGGTPKVTTATPLLMRAGNASGQLAEGVSRGHLTHAVAGSVVFETLSEYAWESAGEGWSRPAGSKGDYLVWARPLSEADGKRFPFPSLRADGAIQISDPDKTGYSRTMIMAF
jgi:hypothetical protein